MTIFVDAVVYYKIYDPVISITNIRNASWGTRLLAQTMLRNVLGAHSLSDTMTNRELLANQLLVRELPVYLHTTLLSNSFRLIWMLLLILGV